MEGEQVDEIATPPQLQCTVHGLALAAPHCGDAEDTDGRERLAQRNHLFVELTLACKVVRREEHQEEGREARVARLEWPM